jgi:TetR/AcrR family transcriptional regulator, cholesterol catabolism regulator
VFILIKISLEERKDFISKVATKVFSKKGYQTASLQDLADEAKICKAGIYHYFKSKEEILAYILINISDRFLEKLKNGIKKIKEQGLSPQQSFKKIMEIYAQQVNNEEEKRSLVLRERHQLTGRNKIELYRREQAIFRLMKRELQKIHNLDKSIDPNVITFLFISMSHWLGFWFKEGKKSSLEAIIDQNIRVIFDGILKRERS